MGNYQLTERYAHHYQPIDNLSAMFQESRDIRQRQFLSDKGRDRGVVQSNNGLRTFYSAPSSGKNPNQVKRKRAEKSLTHVKRLVLGTI
ncbi:hypothetical protein DPMN_118579 [Dreissena polymorpha]|uniref:Uncharacterized protein n=1 Tax=Dreissena polymorpha TaxID=45954 RepID=A0A9D4GGP7_DREPO|nr:hypothetical protein DPMN_118579 [Dreissena polymorpha]